MMINLFSTFDPATTYTTQFNWSVLLLTLICIPLTINILLNQHTIPLYIIIKNINKELTTMNMNKPKGVLIVTMMILWVIISSNCIGLLPYTFTSTSHLTTTLPLSLLLWLGLMMFGYLKNTKKMLTHTLPMGSPMMLMNFMVCIETISMMIRPITLSVRLAANMIAGHLLITLISNTMCYTNYYMTLFMLIPEMSLLILEVAVAMIQGYVFMTLTTLYFSETM